MARRRSASPAARATEARGAWSARRSGRSVGGEGIRLLRPASVSDALESRGVPAIKGYRLSRHFNRLILALEDTACGIPSACRPGDRMARSGPYRRTVKEMLNAAFRCIWPGRFVCPWPGPDGRGARRGVRRRGVTALAPALGPGTGRAGTPRPASPRPAPGPAGPAAAQPSRAAPAQGAAGQGAPGRAPRRRGRPGPGEARARRSRNETKVAARTPATTRKSAIRRAISFPTRASRCWPVAVYDVKNDPTKVAGWASCCRLACSSNPACASTSIPARTPTANTPSASLWLLRRGPGQGSRYQLDRKRLQHQRQRAEPDRPHRHIPGAAGRASARPSTAAPIDPKVLEEQQKKLQEELQKRSDELRKRASTTGRRPRRAGLAAATPAGGLAREPRRAKP